MCRYRNRNEFPEASGVYHFHAAEVDHQLTSLRQQPGYFAGQHGGINAISDSSLAANGDLFSYSGFETASCIGNDLSAAIWIETTVPLNKTPSRGCLRCAPASADPFAKLVK